MSVLKIILISVTMFINVSCLDRSQKVDNGNLDKMDGKVNNSNSHEYYENMTESSDLIIIGSLIETLDIKRTSSVDHYKYAQSTFFIKTTLKGAYEGSEIDVQHLKLKEGQLVDNGLELAVFEKHISLHSNDGNKIEINKPDYLLFLKKGANSHSFTLNENSAFSTYLLIQSGLSNQAD